MFWNNSFCKNYNRITIQSKFLGLFSCKKGHASGSNITKKISGQIIFVIITKIITKENVQFRPGMVISSS